VRRLQDELRAAMAQHEAALDTQVGMHHHDGCHHHHHHRQPLAVFRTLYAAPGLWAGGGTGWTRYHLVKRSNRGLGRMWMHVI
jgi:hypothetical protein